MISKLSCRIVSTISISLESDTSSLSTGISIEGISKRDSCKGKEFTPGKMDSDMRVTLRTMLPMGKENSYGLMEVATMEKSFTAKGQDKANIFVLKIVHTIRDHGKMDLNRAKAL